VIYFPETISYDTLVELFWTQIDPVDAGGQFADRGYHYTTAIYYNDEIEKSIAEASKKSLQDS
jgi:peptide methionine sulfoxide reductase msrA/msrB